MSVIKSFAETGSYLSDLEIGQQTREVAHAAWGSTENELMESWNPANTEERLGYHVDPISGTAITSASAAALAVKWKAARPVVKSMAWEMIVAIALEEVQVAT